MSQKKNVIEEQSINDINYELLKKQFPHAVGINENGKYVIDPQKLQMSLDPAKAEIKEDGYGLNWVGKKEAYHKAFEKNYKVLKPLKEDSKNWDKTENILIKGDNLDALKILRHNYFESIKMIYIDPPYNTKNDGFVYNDDFTSSTEKTLEELGYDEDYIDYIENIQGAKTHSGWLSFMYPRLLLAYDLLKDNGAIFISIDDNEVSQLKLLCDEIFGEDNFVANIIVQSNPRGRTLDKYLAKTFEYILVYTKEDHKHSLYQVAKSEKALREYNNQDKDGKYRLLELRNRNPVFTRENRPNLFFPIYINPQSLQVSLIKTNEYSEIALPRNSKNEDGCWTWGKEKVELDVKLLTAKQTAEGVWRVFRKDYIPDNGAKTKEKTLWIDKNINHENGKEELGRLFGSSPFSFPKSVELIKKCLNIGLSSNDIVLDFFAGSGTTAHAVMDLNKGGGNRKFICVQLAEEVPDKSEAQKAGYKTIFDITQERINRAGSHISKGDIGFRTFEIVEDQKQKIYQKSLEEVSQDDLIAMMEKSDIETNEDILYNLFIAEALPLTIKHQELIKDKLYLASNVAFILGDITSDELVDALKDKKECEYITVYSPNISDDKFTLELESNISKIGIKPDKLRFRG